MLKIIVLNDNRNNCDEFDCEHGLSLYIEANQTKILFDAGQSNVFINNAKKMGINLEKLDYVVLSHGDYDHGNGLKFLDLKNKIKLFAHNDIFKNRISKRTNKYGGLNQDKNSLKNKFDLVLSNKPTDICDNIIFLGEIEKTNDFEKGGLPMIDESGDEYPHHDDSGIVIKTTQGLVVISGCAHSGICNTIEYAKKITGEKNVFAVIGGFHLKEINDKTQNTKKYLKQNNVKNVLLAHCTSDEVCFDMAQHLSPMAQIISVGKIYEWSI